MVSRKRILQNKRETYQKLLDLFHAPPDHWIWKEGWWNNEPANPTLGESPYFVSPPAGVKGKRLTKWSRTRAREDVARDLRVYGCRISGRLRRRKWDGMSVLGLGWIDRDGSVYTRLLIYRLYARQVDTTFVIFDQCLAFVRFGIALGHLQ